MPVLDIPEITRLTTPEKILMVEELWESITSDEQGITVPQSHKEALDTRLVRYETGPGMLLSLDELQERIDNQK